MMAEQIDDFAKRIMERTRERREMLAKKMADTSPRRKRSSPRSSSQLHDITNKSQEGAQESDSPHKRTCVRDDERTVHDDTPAVRGVKSRMQALTQRRNQWFNTDDAAQENMDAESQYDAAPLQQPVFDDSDQHTEKPARKTRLAALAQSINSWEDDLSHPTIRQEEKPKKKVWQPPKQVEPAESEPAPSKPPRTYEHEPNSKFVSPTRRPLEDALSPPKSHRASRPPVEDARSPAKCDRASRSPRKAVSSMTVTLHSGGATSTTSTSGTRHTSAVRDTSPYRATSSAAREPSPYKSNASATVREPSPFRNSASRLRDTSPAKPVSSIRAPSPGRHMTSAGSASSIRAPSPGRSFVGNSVPKPYASPAKAQLVTSTTSVKSDTVHSTTVVVAPASSASAPPAKTNSRRSDIHEPTKKPVADRMQAWRQRTDGAPAPRQTGAWQNKPNPALDRLQPKAMRAVLEQSMLHDDDPLNMSMHSRLNVWETKIHDTEHEHAARPQQQLMATKTPDNTRHPSGGAVPESVRTQSRTPVKQVSSSSATSRSPLSKSPKHSSPSKVGEATRALHSRLEAFQHGWQNNEIAEKIKQQKELDMAVLTNRWKTGVRQPAESTAGQAQQDWTSTGQAQHEKPAPPAYAECVPRAPPPPTVSGASPRKPVSESRQQERHAMRKVLPNGDGTTHRDTLPAPRNFEEKLQMMGFNVESDPDHNHKASCDLTPYRERDKRARQQQQQHKSPKKAAAPSAPKQTVVTVEDTRVIEVHFDDEQRNTVVKRPLVSATTVFTPSKPSTAYAQRTAAGKTPSIYGLIKKNTGGHAQAYNPPCATATPDALKRSTTRKDSFSDDSFESDGGRGDRERLADIKKSVTFGSQDSMYSEISETTTQYTESQVDTQSESETEDTAATTEDYSTGDEESSESETEGNVSALLDEALSDCEPEAPQPAVTKRTNYAHPAARPPRPTTLPPQDSDVESTTSAEYYSTRANRCSAPAPGKRVKFASHEYSSTATSTQSSSNYSSSSAAESENEPAYSIDMYRRSKSKINAPVPKMTIVRHSDAHRKEMQERQDPLPYTPTKSAKERLQELQSAVHLEQEVIMQTSNALNQCCGTNSTFAGSQQAVECHKLLLIACKKRETYISEMHNLRQGSKAPRVGPQGSLTISDIRLPLKQDFMHRMGGHQDLASHYFLLLVRHGDHVVFTQMKGTHDAMVQGTLDVLSKGTLEIPNMIKFSDISQDFRLELEVYGMSVTREDPSAKSSKKKKGLTPKKLLKGGGRSAFMNSPGGPAAVRSTNFVLVGHMLLDARALNKTHFTLDGVPFLSPLHGTVHLRLRCVIENTVEERGFLTMFEDVSGFGAWHRRWFILKNSHLSYWKYPDDEKCKEPLGYMELKQVVTDRVGLIPRDICARPNTFELITVRRQAHGESDTLTSRCYNTVTTSKHWLSADTKEDRMLWCNRINEALVNIRTWHTDALRPVKQKDFVQPYNPYPSKSDQRSCIIPFNPHDQQSAV